MGRRGVQQLTPAEWREALEQQIREKEQQRASHEAPHRRSQSAPQQQDSEELVPSVPRLRASTSTFSREGEGSVAGRRRCFQQQSREDYIKGLKEQIEEKKRLAQEAQEKERVGRRRLSSKENDDAEVRRESCTDGERQTENENAETNEPHLELQDRIAEAKSTGLSNQDQVEPCPTPALKVNAGDDPVAITKIADFCEELKKQNEDVKRQLSEQHDVLSRLHSSLAGETENNDVRSASKFQGKTQFASVKKTKAKGPKSKLPVVLTVVPRPRPARGETKIPFPGKRPSSLLRSTGVDIVKGFSQMAQPESTLQKAEEKTEIRTRVDKSPIEDKVLATESLSKNLGEEYPPVNEIETNSLNIKESVKRQDFTAEVLRDEVKDKANNDYSPKESLSANTCDLGGISACIALQSENIDDELPIDAESKLVHDWESCSISDKMLECTSIAILDGSSSLISLDKPLLDLFQ
ncbi:hypothetical protein PHMEG_000270 [Phytophthora megakarya]|uniref:Uncharacterized protein n=1 Tax=Phytophthora megakarya TaxID=4795 RepID=A0A225X600_9STRA|nr:hypothetical protein PHMEG_000270 [Phytophthora megakarya]